MKKMAGTIFLYPKANSYLHPTMVVSSRIPPTGKWTHPAIGKERLFHLRHILISRTRTSLLRTNNGFRAEETRMLLKSMDERNCEVCGGGWWGRNGVFLKSMDEKVERKRRISRLAPSMIGNSHAGLYCTVRSTKDDYFPQICNFASESQPQ